MNQNQCQHCGALTESFPLWADTRLYHILEANAEPGEVNTVGAALITNAPAAIVEDACIVSRASGNRNWVELESFIHANGYFAMVAKWEVRFL